MMVIRCTPKKCLNCKNDFSNVQKYKTSENYMTFKALGGMTPEYLTQMFHVSDNKNYQLR